MRFSFLELMKQTDRRSITVSKHHRDLLNRCADAADLTAKELAEILIELAADGEIEIIRQVYARLKRDK